MEQKKEAATLALTFMSKGVSMATSVECAIVLVDKLITELRAMPPEYVTKISYWIDVKLELEKLIP